MNEKREHPADVRARREFDSAQRVWELHKEHCKPCALVLTRCDEGRRLRKNVMAAYRRVAAIEEG